MGGIERCETSCRESLEKVKLRVKERGTDMCRDSYKRSRDLDVDIIGYC